MSDDTGGLRARVIDLATVVLGQAGLSQRQTLAVKQAGRRWLDARGDALRHRTGLVPAEAVVWTSHGPAELLVVEVRYATGDEVTVAVDTTVVSTGTERAWYLGMPNTPTKRPHRPGASGAGVVAAVGPAVNELFVGDRVAGRFPHQSVVTVPASTLHRVPSGVALADAALVTLAEIAGYGIRRADLQHGERVAVLGLGVVGAVALRLAIAAGAGPSVALATSRRRAAIADASGVPLITIDDTAAIEGVGADVVIEATGDASAIGHAVTAAAPGGRVVLLGSPRGLVSRLPVGEIRRKGLRVIGAHVSGLDREARATGTDGAGEITRSFLEHLARGELRVDDLCPDVVRPGDAGAFYHRLSVGDAVIGARFEWHESSKLPAATLRLARLLAPPSVGVRGIDADHRPRRARRALPGGFPPETGRVRFGLVGCGEVAVETADAIASAPNTSLPWCFDVVSELAADLAAKHGANVAPTLEALLARDDVDAVVISVPHHLHASLSIEAMRAGKHVITEKPPASSLADAVAMAKVARDTGVAFSVLLPNRYARETASARQLIREGALGTITGGFAAGWLDKPPMYMTGGFTGRTVSDWRASRERAGGGVLIMNASHTVDAIRFLSGLEIEEVVAGMGALDAPAEVEDAMAVVIRLDNGAIVTLHAGAAVRGVTSNELRLWGTDGHVQVSPSLQVFTRRALTDLVANRWQSLTTTQSAASSRAQFLSSFASAITEGRMPDVGVDDALALQAAIEAMYRAATTGSAVRPAEVLKDALGAEAERP